MTSQYRYFYCKVAIFVEIFLDLNVCFMLLLLVFFFFYVPDLVSVVRVA